MDRKRRFLPDEPPRRKNDAEEELWTLRHKVEHSPYFEALTQDGELALGFCIWQLSHGNNITNNLSLRIMAQDPEAFYPYDEHGAFMGNPDFAEQVRDTGAIIETSGLHLLAPGVYNKEQFDRERRRFTAWLHIQPFKLPNPLMPLTPEDRGLYDLCSDQLSTYAKVMFSQSLSLYLRLLAVREGDEYKYDHYRITC